MPAPPISRFDAVERFCLFVGYPRSGHSLVGSLLDAHPDMVIAHELDALALVAEGCERDELYARITEHDQAFTDAGRQWMGYEYAVPGQWQGRHRHLRVVGDKKGGGSTERLATDPGALDHLEQLVGVPVVLLHVVRNPWDNIATIAKRSGCSIAESAARYGTMCVTVGALRERGHTIVDVGHEQLIRAPAGELERVCGALGLDADDDYLAACASVVFPAPRRTRDDATWSDADTALVERLVQQHGHLAGYSFAR